MSPHDNRSIVEQFWSAIKSRDLDAQDRLVSDDYVQEWPQSGERIRGKANAHAVKQNYPTERTPELRRIRGAGDLWVMETTIDYGTEVAHGVHVIEMQGGKIIRETDYFSQPFEAPEWRAKWVERM
ncbi:MAG TPA: nuclear transport factor 2 family protein [Candidatus Dormibacteraeota bacterium]|jgi:ketosteroid isomerase-like protein|nr:nuclear transport factor 2 family protein [Candidatus Dormibacteraeota bacterium]